MAILNNSMKAAAGEKFVADYFRSKKYQVMKRPSGQKGFDFLAKKGNKVIKIEVKTSHNFDGGIPDMHSNEFNEIKGQFFLVADFLCIVRLDGRNRPMQLDILSREEVDKYNNGHRKAFRYRLSPKLKRDLRDKRIGKSAVVKTI